MVSWIVSNLRRCVKRFLKQLGGPRIPFPGTLGLRKSLFFVGENVYVHLLILGVNVKMTAGSAEQVKPGDLASIFPIFSSHVLVVLYAKAIVVYGWVTGRINLVGYDAEKISMAPAHRHRLPQGER